MIALRRWCGLLSMAMLVFVVVVLVVVVVVDDNDCYQSVNARAT